MPILTRNNEFSHLQHEKTTQHITKASCVPMEEEKIEKKKKKRRNGMLRLECVLPHNCS
jgi:hypothetical protein